MTTKLIEMDSGVCFALLKVADESGSKLKDKSVSILKISRSCFRGSAKNIRFCVIVSSLK